MTWRRLVCAHCAAPVDLGRCASCRRERDEQRTIPAALAVLLAAILAAALLAASVLAGGLRAAAAA